jgi:NIMA (never in mitosis gene a)-related kinase
VPAHYSKNITYLLSTMLKTNPNERPSINQILKINFIKQRVASLLNEDDFKDEFSHTILHNQNVFEVFRQVQAKKKK